MSDEQRKKRGRLSLWLMAFIAIAPVLGAYALYYWWTPTSFTNYGQLLPPTPITDVIVRRPDGTEVALDTLKGKWLLLMVDAGACGDFCREKLYKMRQVRLTQGKEMERIERVWLVDDDAAVAPAIASEYEGTLILSARGMTLGSRLPATASVRDHIYVVDPLGNLMMRYPRDADPSKMKKDVTKLLKVSRIG